MQAINASFQNLKKPNQFVFIFFKSFSEELSLFFHRMYWSHMAFIKWKGHQCLTEQSYSFMLNPEYIPTLIPKVQI
jgi:hypothetical protein